ncbi:hypothetical protein Tco_1002057 [Tanacetum coccineum]|uniref:Uncharacterized protein n=1 Tax=Tanacetum coccineum TaxID=301880 RepID=A0ABQ5F647_9ASTR
MSQPANDDFSQHLSDGEESNHEDASDTGAAPKPQQQMIPQTTAISNIKLPILKKEEYDIWAMEMEHYLEYIDNEVWKVIQNGNSKKRISTGKDGVIRVLSPVSAAEIQAVEKERKAKNILLMAIPKEHMRRFHGMDDAKEIWEAIRTRFGGNANSKKMQKAVFKQQFEAFKISNSEGLEKGYDRFQQLLSQLEAHGAEVSTEDANHKFLRSLPSAWSNLAMTMRTNPEIDNLSIDDLYNNLRVFEQEIQGAPKPSSSAQNVAFVSQSKSSTNKVKSGFSGAYSSCTPSTSSTNVPEKEVLAGFADEVIYSLFAKQTEDLDLLHEDLEQIDDVDIEEMDINWQIAMIAIRMKKFYKKTGRRVRVDGKTPQRGHMMERRRETHFINTKKSGKRRKQMARKGLHTDLDKDDSEGSDEVSEQDDSVTGTKIPINPVPVAMKVPSIATYKIIKQGEKGVYQIVREDGTDIVYINFGAMLKDISRDDLTELYRIVMNRYGMDGPEDELEKVFWKYLKNMFEEPLSTDPIWSELGQQRIISWRYYDSCRVHCLNLESMDIYMLIERTYPLSAEMCKAMLDKKLQGGKPDENCYKMLKMMEKQAGIRK